MVIVCPECTTKFKVNQDRIPGSGAKVRCARCKHVFWAAKPAAEEALTDLAASESPRPEPEPFQEESTRPEESQNSAAPIAPTSAPEAEIEENHFDYDQFREQDTQKAEESFTFSGATEEQRATSEPEGAATFDGKETFSFGEEPPEEQAAAADAALSEDSAAADRSSTPQLIDEESAADSQPQTAATEKPKAGVLSSIIRILLVLILSILVIGGVLLYMNGPQQLEQVIQQLLGQQIAPPAETGQITLDKLQGKFLNNQEAGELFVIRGEAINKFSTPQASVQVKGVIFDQNGKSLLQKTIFCGNPISDEQLQLLTFDKIEELMGNQFGKSLSNMNINTDQSIPFVIVFRDLPQSLSEFSVDVTSSKPATP